MGSVFEMLWLPFQILGLLFAIVATYMTFSLLVVLAAELVMRALGIHPKQVRRQAASAPPTAADPKEGV